MPSDTERFVAILRATNPDAYVFEHQKPDTYTFDGDFDLTAAIRSLTPTASEATVIGAGEALKRLLFAADFQRGYGSSDVRVYRADLDVVLAASPKPATDTPVDPGVKGLREAVQREVDGLKGADSPWSMGIRKRLSVALRLAAKPIAGMDAGERSVPPGTR